MSLLELKGLKVSYGGIHAVKGIDLAVKEGQLVTLIGANGAGKTTTMKAITGALAWAGGEVSYQGQSIAGVGADVLLQRGLAMVPEGRGIFMRMTVEENLLMGAYIRDDQAQINADLERMYSFFPRLKERLGQLAGTLSGGEQQMVAMARALMSRPSLLLLDEPSMGLSPKMVETIFEVIRQVSEGGTTILLVEQNARLALQAAHHAYVMDSGLISMSGPASELLNDPQVRVAYLGE